MCQQISDVLIALFYLFLLFLFGISRNDLNGGVAATQSRNTWF